MPTDKEIESVIILDANKRYVYSIKRIADNEALWVLGDEQGFRTYNDNLGNTVFPIWPSKEFALLCCEAEFADCLPEELQLDEFIQDYLPDFKASNYKISVLPLPANKGAVIEVNTFKNDLDNELNNY